MLVVLRGQRANCLMTATTAGMPTLNQDVLVGIIPFLRLPQLLHAERLALVSALPAGIDFNDKPPLGGSAVA
ncbi:hypothetical protein NUW54_g2914 [Trametes sanguinea]|uniref:Uncharacterized protein n=1 Tax=Trametes sanguinea TaxID=158606 RepID=A0ACC1Q3G9_9APHY|nr:hypothetical protein NUW54_g2914 [Trametes sanguinea]